MHDRARRQTARGFTMIEMIVVVVVLALLASMVAPRLVGSARRQAVLAAEEVAELLTLFAHRESMGESKIAVGYDPNAGVIMLLSLVGDIAEPDNPPRWEIDRFVSPVRLPDNMVVAMVRQDGLIVPTADWMVPVVPGRGRPSIEVLLISGDADLEVTVFLAAHSVNARLVYRGQMDTAARVPIDLDLAGRDREVW